MGIAHAFPWCPMPPFVLARCHGVSERTRRRCFRSVLLSAVFVSTIAGGRHWGCWGRARALISSSNVASQGETATASATSVPDDTGVNAQSCKSIRAKLMEKMNPRLARWEKTAVEGRTIPAYGSHATRLLEKTLATFDDEAKQYDDSNCVAERDILKKDLINQLHSIFLVQRSSIEQMLYSRLKRDLLKRMRRKHRELDVKEKLKLLNAAMAEYDSQVGDLMPSFVEESERDRAERRLSELQWGIGDTSEGKEMKQRWKMERMRRMPMRQSKGITASISPGMRLMVRPPGLGNMQMYSRRQVGPPHNPNEVAIGVLNDGDVVDVYNNEPRPRTFKLQPTMAIDLSLG